MYFSISNIHELEQWRNSPVYEILCYFLKIGLIRHRSFGEKLHRCETWPDFRGEFQCQTNSKGETVSISKTVFNRPVPASKGIAPYRILSQSKFLKTSDNYDDTRPKCECPWITNHGILCRITGSPEEPVPSWIRDWTVGWLYRLPGLPQASRNRSFNSPGWTVITYVSTYEYYINVYV